LNSDVELLLLFFRHTPLGLHSTKCRYQSPEWTILSYIVSSVIRVMSTGLL